MIRKFSVKNFKGFRDTLVFNLTKSRDYTFNSHLIKNELINKGIIYGKNGAGKSNLGYALLDLTYHLTDTHKSIAPYEYYYTNLNEYNKVAEFTYEFQFDNDIIVYHYTKDQINSLVYEELICNEKTLVSYDYVKNKYTNNIEELKSLRVEFSDNQLSIIKYIYKNYPVKEDSPIYKLIKYAEGMLWFRSVLVGNDYMGFKNGKESLNDIIIDNDKLKDFEKFLKDNDLDYKLIARKVDEQNIIYAKYGDKEAPFASIISSGTHALWLFYCWKLRFEKVTFLFIDEFDAYYHYETAEYIFKLVSSIPNIQAFVTSHNTYLMKNSIVRPDCCFVISEGHIKALCDCTDKEIREAHNLEKMYRNGAFTE